MKLSILAIALILSPFNGHGDDTAEARSKSVVYEGPNLSPDPRFEIRKSIFNSYSIKGFPEVIFARTPSLETASIKIALKTESGEFHTVMTFERGKPAPERFDFVISREDARLVTIHFYEVLFSGGDTLHLNLGELLEGLQAN